MVDEDRGETWSAKQLIFAGPAAYSSLAAGRDGAPGEGWIYLLFEGGPEGMYSALQVARFRLDWLVKGEPQEGDRSARQTLIE